MKDKNLTNTYESLSLKELIIEANKMIEDLENQKNLENSLEKYQNFGSLDFSLDAFQKNFNTNQYESSLINDLLFKSNKNISNNGFVNGYTLLLRNINTNLKNPAHFQ